ncbi:Zinc finger, C3HC4 type (RING finger)/RING-type zinc-finger/zinc-RING finger domain/EF hand/EF-hand domain pair, putative [Angomonas deanei]|uniref:Zinc finger, C3HC4 type (RING finger)/RING-type zinc-finger/zinc-RING finger domain/EF hand/EF-hand domain pair, putative n=1 Tax=Angomonas deanei TaxID=59799 RepID=A0A7G2CKC1_9TRYP|nr:Zinc finger, C3HC4 type (RING finger)/RING-type zinc-finger/zinc-RING finger domain/EF hand/EF-hand domain pair, putative [Angomonas deanei]
MSVCIGENVNDELVCGVCLDSFNDPVEIRRCGHIYCRKCLTGMKDCPTCREPIESTVAPNRAIVNMALNVQVKCMKCGWKGTRESSNKHVCSSKTKKEAQAAAAPPVQPAQPAPSMNRPPPSNAAPSPAPYTYNFDQFQGYPGAAQAPAPAPTGLYYNGQPTPQPNQAPPQIQSNRRYEVIEPVGNYPWNLYGLTQEEYDQIVSIFVFFDADDSGTLDRQEVSRLAHWLNFARTEAEVNRIFMDMDADGSGSLSQGEFLTWLKYNKPNPKALYGLNQKQYNTIMMQFHGYDRNQDGCLEFEEFAQLVLNLGDVSSREAAMKLFGMIDRQRKGSIDLHQFLTFRAGKVV